MRAHFSDMLLIAVFFHLFVMLSVLSIAQLVFACSVCFVNLALSQNWEDCRVIIESRNAKLEERRQRGCRADTVMINTGHATRRERGVFIVHG